MFDIKILKKFKRNFFLSVFFILILFFSFYSYNAYTFESKTVWWDEAVYLSLAKNFLEEKSLVIHINRFLKENNEAFRSPFFPSIIVILLFLFGSVKAIYFFNYIIMILFVILTFLFFKNKNNIFLSLTTILIFLSINTVFITTKALAEPLELFFTITFFYILFFKKNYEYLIPIIIIFGFLTKYSLIILFFTYIFYIILEYYFYYFKNKSFILFLKEKFNYKFFLSTIFSLSILTLWFYHNYFFYKNILGALKENSIIVNYSFKKTSFFYYFKILLENTKLFFYTSILGIILLLRDIFLKEKEEKIQDYTILFFVTTFFLSISFVYEKNYRYLFPIIIFYSYFSAYSIVFFLKKIKTFLKKIFGLKEDNFNFKTKNNIIKIKSLKEKKNKKYRKEEYKNIILFFITFFLQLTVLIVLNYNFYNNFSYNINHAYYDKQDNYNFRIVAEFLKNNTNINESLMSLYRQPWFYYTNRSIVWYPEYANAFPEMISKYNVKFILLEKNVIPQLSWSESFLNRHNYSLPVYNETYGDYYFKKVLEEHSNKTNTTIIVYKPIKVNVFG